MIDFDKEREIVRELLETIMRMSRDEVELRAWATEHAAIIKQEMSESDIKHLRDVYLEIMKEFDDRKEEA